MNDIKKIYQHAGKCDDQQDLTDILEPPILSTPEEFTDNSPNIHMTLSPVKKPSSRKSLCLVTNILDVETTTVKRRFVAEKYRRKYMKVGNSLWKKTKTKRASKINEKIKRNLYTWITRHP